MPDEATASPGVRVLRPVVRDIVADTITPISAYLALAAPGRSCLLESVEGADRIARYSFIGLDYLESTTIDGDPAMADRIRAIVARYHIERSVDIPFPGGVVCAFTYDAARNLERLGTKPPVDVAFPDAVVVVPGTWIIFDHFTHRVRMLGFATVDRSESLVRMTLDRYVERMLNSRSTLPGDVQAGFVSMSLSRDEFLARVERAKASIFEGDVYQIQLGVRFSCDFDGTAFDLYRQIRARNPSPYMFFMEDGDRATFGASPEFLVRLDGRRAQLRPLAGTRSRGVDDVHDESVARELLANEKERAEHVMLVDLGRNDLSAVCEVGSVRVDELMKIERYSHVMHIVSNVVGTLRTDRDALDLFAAAFPAGTVTGAPKIRAMQLIDEMEPVARGFYAGSIAHIDFDGDMDSCIVLRSVAVAGGRAYWQASAGIVADSEPEAEYAEILHKTRIVREALGIA